MPQPLPPNSYVVGSRIHQAYETCLALQASAPQLQAPWRNNPMPLVCARLLGYMIIYSPTSGGRNNICNEINSCRGDRDQLLVLAKFYIDRYLRSFRSAKGRTPAPSDHPSRPSFDEMQETIKYLLKEPPQNHTDAKIGALQRDGYRCMISGVYDMESCEKFIAVATMATNSGIIARPTQASHIFAPSTSADITGKNEDGPKHNYAASAWAVMERMGSVLVPDELNGPDIHRLENVMTLETGIHTLFDNLKLWLDADPNVQHQYHLRSTNNALYIQNLPQTVTFTSTAAHFALPDPRYLALHAACARVAHLSGAGEHIDAIDRDLKSTRVLATNGSSAWLLEAALSRRTDISVF